MNSPRAALTSPFLHVPRGPRHQLPVRTTRRGLGAAAPGALPSAAVNFDRAVRAGLVALMAVAALVAGCRRSPPPSSSKTTGAAAAAARDVICLERTEGCVECVATNREAPFLEPEESRPALCDPREPDNCVEFCSAVTAACALPWSQEPGCVFETDVAFRRALFVRVSAARPEVLFIGRVVDEQGRRIEGAQIRVWVREGAQLTPIQEEVSGKDGGFRVSLRAGSWSYALRVSHPDFASEILQRLTPDRAEKTGSGPRTFRMRPAQTLRGRVVDNESGAPVPGAIVQALRASEDTIEAADVHTSEDGTFTLGGLEPRRYHLRVAKFGWRTSTSRAQVPEPPASAPRVTLKLSRASVIRGSVKDGQGELVPNATLAAVLSAAPGTPALPILWTSDRDGAFAQEHTPGTYYLWARRGDMFAYPPAKVELAEGADVELSMVLQHRGARIVGRVQPHAGYRLPGNLRAVLLSRSSLAFPRSAVSEVSSDGAFELSGVLPGRYELSLREGPYALGIVAGPREVEVPVDPGSTVTLKEPVVVRPQIGGE
jgi:hypothetical protein